MVKQIQGVQSNSSMTKSAQLCNIAYMPVKYIVPQMPEVPQQHIKGNIDPCVSNVSPARTADAVLLKIVTSTFTDALQS